MSLKMTLIQFEHPIPKERDREKNRVGAAVLTHFNISQWGL